MLTPIFLGAWLRRELGEKGWDASCARISYEQTDPVLLVYTGRCLEAVRWAPSDRNLVAAVSSDDASVQVFDLQYTKASFGLVGT